MTAHTDLIPTQEIPEAAWSLLTYAANNVIHPMRVVTLATVDASPKPQARLMILRGANRTLGRVWFHTDRHSRKVRELQHSSGVCVVAYDPSGCIELRLSGLATLHEHDALAHDLWQQTNVALQHAYGALPPDSPLPFNDPRLQTIWQHRGGPGLETDRRRFLVIQLQVETIEWLQAIGAKQVRVVMRASERWKPRRPRRDAWQGLRGD